MHADGRGVRRRLRLAAVRTQRRTAGALGVSWAHRTDTVIAMLASNARRAPGYWIQLTLAMGIATLGLVLGSTAVVIGAMLVSPLMGPIVELGMGFAVGSSLLTIRAAFRVLRSVAAVVAGATFITVLLPFHEVTGEIAARTTPTALDLMVAVCCALTAAYTTVRAASDTTAAAAGTAVGIALVPPLCVVGYGLGTRAPDVAAGAALLFTANFSAIVVFSVLAFVLLGFNWVDARRLERDYLRRDRSIEERAAERVHGVLGRLFGSRYGMAMRIGLPALFLAFVYAPLARALDEVAWQVRVRAAIGRLVSADAPSAVQTQLSVERRRVSLRLLVLGPADDAVRLERRLRERITRTTGVTDPEVTVAAVADAGALATAVSRAQRGDRVERTAPALDLRTSVGEVLAVRWPAAVVGPVLAWSAELPPVGTSAEPVPLPPVLLVTVRHLGAPLGPAAETLLADALADALGTPVRVATLALPTDSISAPPGAETRWLVRVTPVLDLVAATPGAWACVEAPPGRPAPVTRRTLATSAAATAGRLAVRPGGRWALRVAAGGCPAPGE